MTRFRSIILLVLGLLLLWGLPLPYGRAGGIGNYDCWRFGVFGWAHHERLVSGFRVPGVADSQTEFDYVALGITALVSVALTVGIWCARRRGTLVTKGALEQPAK